MTLSKFKHYAEQRRFLQPDPHWTVKSLMRLYEFFKTPVTDELRIDSKQLIDCLTWKLFRVVNNRAGTLRFLNHGLQLMGSMHPW